MRNARLLIALTFAFVLTGCAVHSNQTAPKASPSRWNYLQETTCASTEKPFFQPVYMKETLERRGAEGWELVSYHSSGAGTWGFEQFWLKRPIGD